MKTKRSSALMWVAALAALQLAVSSARAQTSVLINAFDTSDEVTDNNGNPWGNWFGTAFYQVLWDASDASNNPASGSMQIQAFYPDSGIGGCCGPQSVAYDQNNGISPALAGNGAPPTSALATNIEFDFRFDPASAFETNQLGTGTTNWPTIEVGTRGVDFGQHDFGTFTIPVTQTNWVHEVISIAPSPNWTTIPNVYFKYYSTTLNGWVYMFVDNIRFTTAPVAIVPPTMSISKPTPGLRFFSSPGQYSRSQLVAVDTNQSWVGGSYPVSYSFTISAYDNNPPLNEFHLFLIPLNSDQGGVINQYTDYSTGSNSVRLQIVAMGAGSNTVVAQLAWKTNIVNSNPTVTELNITNATAIGTWTLTFTNVSGGTLTAPGASPAPFAITDPSVAADFANPVALFFGLQPNLTTAIGQHADFTRFQTVNVASPGVAINDNFATDTSVNTNVWSTGATADPNAMDLVQSSAAWWVSWTFPDYSSVLATAPGLPALVSTVPWKTPFWYTGYNTNNPIYQYNASGGSVWSLIPTAALPTVDGSSNGVVSTKGYFRLMEPGPAQ